MYDSLVLYLLIGVLFCLGLSTVSIVKMLFSMENGYLVVAPKYLRIMAAGALTMIISGIIHAAIIDTLYLAEVVTAVVILGAALATMVAAFQASRGQGLNNAHN